MGQIGHFGKIKFHVNVKRGKPDILSFSDFNWKSSVNVEEHKRQGKKPFLEVTDRNADEITMQIYLSAYLGQSPMAKWKILRNYCLESKPKGLFLGGKRLGSYKFLIVDVSNTPTEFYKNGKMVAAKVSVTFKEYPYKKKSKKAKTSSSKKRSKKKGKSKKGSAKNGKASAKSSGSSKKKATNKGYASYTVKKGDTLWGIAKAKLGSGAKYKKIYNANKTTSKGFHKITNPSLIMPGWVIRIPKS